MGLCHLESTRQRLQSWHFGSGRQSEIRHVQTESIEWLIELAARAGAERLVINGSYVTDVLEPNDVDCVLLISDDFPKDADAEA